MGTEVNGPFTGLLLGPFTTTGALPELEACSLSGGAFGTLVGARHIDGSEAVVKLCRANGGGLSNTVSFGRTLALENHSPNVAYLIGDNSEDPRHITMGLGDVADALRQEARVLEHARGVLLPAFLGLFEYMPPGQETTLPALAMEHIRGYRPKKPSDVVRVVESMAQASESGHLDYHGDLKPEHIFIDDVAGTVRLIDPAPRLKPGFGAFTPEYNPYGLTGPVSDVFATAVILYLMIARVPPFVFVGRPTAPVAPASSEANAWTLELPPPIARGRTMPKSTSQINWESLTTFVDEILGSRPDTLPSWAFDYRRSFERLTDGAGA